MIIEEKKDIVIPKWSNGIWTVQEFKSREKVRDFLIPLFKEPGEYNFGDASLLFNGQAKKFMRDGYYLDPTISDASSDYKAYWDREKDRCRNGVIFQDKGLTWYLPRAYYMWINFLQIFDKVKEKFEFPQVWDGQYHMSLFNTLALLHDKHVSQVKKRQFGSSFYYAAEQINHIYFEEGFKGKIGASLKDYVKKTWKFLEDYRNFLNQNTGWYRNFTPGKFPKWEQLVETEEERRGGKIKVTKGFKGQIEGMSFEKDPITGVGGGTKIFFYEEGGISKDADKTYGYMKSALKLGQIITGQFKIAGAVGELDQCEPLKKFIYQAKANGFYTAPNKYVDRSGVIADTGLFIPEQWNMPPYIDEYGNSLVAEALVALEAEFAQLEKDLTPEDYQLEVSQRARTLEEAFGIRKESIFPPHLIASQEKKINDKEYPFEVVELSRSLTDDRVIEIKKSNKVPIHEFPLSKKAVNKEGAIVIYRRPDKNAELGECYATIDPVKEGKTTTSPSLCSIYIIRRAIEVTQETPEGLKVFIEPEEMMATWCGRFDDADQNHERCLLMIELYNARTLVENNVTDFVRYMIEKRKQKYLIRKDEMIFLKELESNKSVYQDYGWRNTGRIFSDHMLDAGVKYFKEVLDTITDDQGNILRKIFGVTRIKDIMLLKEAKAYQDGLNVDRLVAWCALVIFMRIQQANRGYLKRLEKTDAKDGPKSDKIVKLAHSPFRHIGKQGARTEQKPSRKPFRHIR